MTHGDRRGPQEQPRVGDPVVGVEADVDAGALEQRRRVHPHPQDLLLAARRVHQGERDADACGGQLVGEHPRLGAVLQHHVEAELALEPQHGRDVVVTVGVMLDATLPLQDLGDGLELEIAVRPALVVVVCGRVSLGQVGLAANEQLAHHRRRLGPRARKRLVAHRVRAVGHLHAAADASVVGSSQNSQSSIDVGSARSFR